jgi:apolipoprotein N-acyltransferase
MTARAMSLPPSAKTPERSAPRLALAALAGLLHGQAFAPPLQAWWLQLATLAALFALTHPLRPRQSLAPTALFGLGWFIGGLAWLHTSMHVYGGMPWLLAAVAVVLFAAYLTLFPVAAVALAARLAPSGRGFAHALLLAGAWGLFEWLRGLLFTGFPWLVIGYAHVDSPLAGYAPWLGVYGIGAIAALIAALIAQQAGSLKHRWRAVSSSATDPHAKEAGSVAALATIAGLIVVGSGLALLEHTQMQGSAVKVRLVQGNIPQQMKFDPERAIDAMHRYTRTVASSDAALIVLPETAWTMPWSGTPPRIASDIGHALSRSGAQLAIGMPLRAQVTDGQDRLSAFRYTNSVALIRPSAAIDTPAIVSRYDKRHLVPFGEFIPTGFGWFVALMNIPLGEFGRGAPVQPAFEVGGQRFAFNVCYEDLFGEEIVQTLRTAPGASVLVNVSNLAWFGDSQALPQHLAIARMRTLETGRPMLRATNTGVTASIDHRGRVLAQLQPYTDAVLDLTVQGTTGLTPYARFGNLLALALFATLALAGYGALRRKAWRKS